MCQYICEICGKEFKSGVGLSNHKRNHKQIINYEEIQKYIDEPHTWNQTLEYFKISNGFLQKANENGYITFKNRKISRKGKLKRKFDYDEIQKYIDENHSYDETIEHFNISRSALHKAKNSGWIKFKDSTESRIIRISLGITQIPTHTKETKEKLSKIMKQRHEDGTAWNIGMSRWNNEPSYPEKFFMKVIENEFIDKEYKTEYPFTKYSLDFAWVHLKKCIEIDGEQHQRFEDYKERDKKKDALLYENGWQILRITWKDMFNNTQYWINIAKNFIDCG